MADKNNMMDISMDKLNALVDGELNSNQREDLLARLDEEPELRAELCDIHRVKDLVEFAYPLKSVNKLAISSENKFNIGVVAASLLVVLSIGFLGGYFIFNQNIAPNKLRMLNKSELKKLEDTAVSITDGESSQQKIIIYLGSSEKEKFNETLNKAESLLTQYKKEGAMVYVVTSAGGIDLLRTSNTESHERIKTMSKLYKNLNFVACNNQIYQLHKQGKPVHLVDEVKMAPSAVQFVVDHLKKGWKYIAI